MNAHQIGALIAVIGLISQLAGTLLLVGLFAALLRSHPRPQPYFRQWTLGWTALVVALCGVGTQYAFPRLMAAEPLAPRVANLVYLSGPFLNVVMVFQTPVLVAPFLVCGWLLLRFSIARHARQPHDRCGV